MAAEGVQQLEGGGVEMAWREHSDPVGQGVDRCAGQPLQQAGPPLQGALAELGGEQSVEVGLPGVLRERPAVGTLVDALGPAREHLRPVAGVAGEVPGDPPARAVALAGGVEVAAAHLPLWVAAGEDDPLPEPRPPAGPPAVAGRWESRRGTPARGTPARSKANGSGRVPDHRDTSWSAGSPAVAAWWICMVASP